MDYEDAKIWNARFTLLHTAIQELAQVRLREYETLEKRVEILEIKINKTSRDALLKGLLCGSISGFLASIFFSIFFYYIRN